MALMQQLLVGLEAVRWEWVATALACIFVLLALGRQRSCWLFAALSAGVSLSIHWHQGATLSLLLNGVYLVLVCYGGWCWLRSSGPPRPAFLSGAARVYLVAIVLAVTLIAGFWLDYYARAQAPYGEAVIVAATLAFLGLLARQYIECWYCLLLSETVSVALALSGGAQANAALHCWYMALALVGIGLWMTVISSARGDQRLPAGR